MKWFTGFILDGRRRSPCCSRVERVSEIYLGHTLLPMNFSVRSIGLGWREVCGLVSWLRLGGRSSVRWPGNLD